MVFTWWFIPLSKWAITLVINGISGVSPLITRVITHLLSGMNHQVPSFYHGNWLRDKTGHGFCVRLSFFISAIETNLIQKTGSCSNVFQLKCTLNIRDFRNGQFGWRFNKMMVPQNGYPSIVNSNKHGWFGVLVKCTHVVHVVECSQRSGMKTKPQISASCRPSRRNERNVPQYQWLEPYMALHISVPKSMHILDHCSCLLVSNTVSIRHVCSP